MATAKQVSTLPRRVILQIVVFVVALVAFALAVANCIQMVARLRAPAGAWPALSTGQAAETWALSLPPPLFVMAWSATDILYWVYTRALHAGTALVGILPLALVVVGLVLGTPQWISDLRNQSSAAASQPGLAALAVTGARIVCFFLLATLIIAYIVAAATCSYNNRYIIRLASPSSRGSFASGWTKVTISSRRDSFGSRWSSYLTSPIQPPENSRMFSPIPPLPPAAAGGAKPSPLSQTCEIV